MTPQTLRTARALLGLSGQEFCGAVGISLTTLRKFELGKSRMMPANMREIVRFLEGRGVEITEPVEGRVAVHGPARPTGHEGSSDE